MTEYIYTDCIVTTDLNTVDKCDLVIETISEDLSLKKSLFEKLDRVVSSTCILVTNTSSIPPELIFESVDNRQRCFGLHFFYPIEWSSIVEVSKINDTKEKYINQIREVVGINFLMLPSQCPLILTYFLCLLICHAYSFYSRSKQTAHEFDNLIKQNLCQFGPLEIIEQTGINIIIQSLNNYVLTDDSKRTKLLNDLIMIKNYKQSNGDRNIVFDFLDENSELVKQNYVNISNESIIESLFEVINFEIIHISNKYDISQESLRSAVYETLKLYV